MFRIYIKKIIAILVTLLLIGCETTLHKGKSFQKSAAPSGQQSLVYVFRVCTPPFYIDADVLFNGEKMMTLPNKGYGAFHVEPGTYNLTIDWPALSGAADVDKEFTFAPGKTHYVGIVSTNCNDLKALVRLQHWFGEWPEDKGLEALKICTLVDGPKDRK